MEARRLGLTPKPEQANPEVQHTAIQEQSNHPALTSTNFQMAGNPARDGAGSPARDGALPGLC